MENIINCNFINNFAALFEKYNFNDNDFIANKRKTAIGRVVENGLPTTKNENWKYANLMFLNDYAFYLTNNKQKSVNQNIVFNNSIIDLKKKNTFVFINGFFSTELSTEFSNELEINKLSELFNNDDMICRLIY